MAAILVIRMETPSTTPNGAYQGFTGPGGSFYDSQGSYGGYDRNGALYDSNGRYLGNIER